MTFPVTPYAADPATATRGWLLDRIALYLERSPDSIDCSVPLAEYGMDSVSALSLCGDLEVEFNLVVDPTLAWDYPTVDALVRYLTPRLPGAPGGDN